MKPSVVLGGILHRNECNCVPDCFKFLEGSAACNQTGNRPVSAGHPANHRDLSAAGTATLPTGTAAKSLRLGRRQEVVGSPPMTIRNNFHPTTKAGERKVERRANAPSPPCDRWGPVRETCKVPTGRSSARNRRREIAIVLRIYSTPPRNCLRVHRS